MRRAVLAIVSTTAGLVMLLSFKTHPEVTAASAAASSSAPATTSSSAPATTTPSSPSTTTTTAPTTSSASTTITGDAVDTRWGPVQVQITMAGGKITAATAVVYPQNNGRDQEINAYAVPTLEQETVSAGNASIDMVSGATYTSNGYIQSLQSALDKA